MLPCAIVVLLLISGAGAAPASHVPFEASAAPSFTVLSENAEERTEELLPIDGNGVRVIVEFRLAPLATIPPAVRSSSGHREVVARFRDDLSRIGGELRQPHERSAPVRVEREFSRAFSGVSLSLPHESIAAVRRLGYVRTVHLDRPVRAFVEPGVDAVNAPEVWAGFGARGSGITVAVIDTGIDYLHPALGGGFGGGFKVEGGYDFVNDDADPMDDNGHGTHVAGTIAANSPELLGVAPEASLVAFKALDDRGVGIESSILAAIERTLDVNGDGDLSDRVDVVNMSLGGPGGYQDPLSRAVDNAVDAGVVFCIAAGNDGAVLSIGSPGTAQKAITVGASTAEQGIASFSSRGPNALDYTIKPDVVAPGANVRSALIGGGTTTASGTSMATPHVAGVAALIREIHPGWTPQMVKSALVTTATPVGSDVMSAGGGRIDALRAAGTALFASPSSISFGVTDGTPAVWTQTRRIAVTNGGAGELTLSVSPGAPQPGISIVVDPSSLTLPPGGSRELEVVLTLDNAAVAFSPTFSRGGYVELSGAGAVARVPWAFVKGLRVRVESDGASFPVALLTGANAGKLRVPLVGDDVLETLALPGSYDLTLFGVPLSSGDGPRIVAFESESVTTHRTFRFDEAGAPNDVSLLAFDEHGTPVHQPEGGTLQCVGLRSLLMPPGAGIPGISTVLPWSAPLVRTSALSPRYALIAADACRDESFTRLYLFHYATARGVTGDLEREAGGAGLHAQPVSLSLPISDEPKKAFAFLASTKVKEELFRGQWFDPIGFGELWQPDRWSGTLYFEASADDEASTLPRLVAEAPESPRLPRSTATFHLVDGRVALFPSEAPPPSAHFWSEAETIPVGEGFLVPRPYFYNFNSQQILVEATYVGRLGEVRRPGAITRLTLLDEAGGTVAEADDGMLVTDYAHRLSLRAINEGSYRVGGAAGRATVLARFGGNDVLGGDNSPPTLTSLRVVDSSGRPADRLAPGSGARLFASAIDYKYAMAIAKPRSETISVSYRRSGSTEWRPLQVVLRGEDYGTESAVGHAPDGTMFEADLREITGGATGFYDLRIVMEDQAGNGNETILEPAIVVGNSRLRPVRR
jgi:subtilisin family serine protease